MECLGPGLREEQSPRCSGPTEAFSSSQGDPAEDREARKPNSRSRVGAHATPTCLSLKHSCE